METNIIITENFYSNVDGVRAFALTQPFDITGNYPGTRTRTFLNTGVKDTIQLIINNAGGKITHWFEEDGFSGSFQLTTAADRSWIHSDNFNTWAGVLYLTPNAPISGGTGLFKHRATGATRPSELPPGVPAESQDMTKWEMTDMIGNKYNRLVLYRGDLFHSSLDYFGSTAEDGRLFQLFFFNAQF
jgi:Family of unknown function (DUF6445)